MNIPAQSSLAGTLCLLFFLTNGPNQATASNSRAVDSANMTTAHNQWRSKTGVPDLTWSNELAASSQQWADQMAQNGCRMQHSTTTHGENIYYAGPAQRSDGTSAPQKITAQKVVDAWGNEVQYYDYASNTCHSVCGHYTQVVWKSTTEVGCGMATCNNKAQIWICQYNPRGNMVGQRPYEKEGTQKATPASIPAVTETVPSTSLAKKNNSSLDQKSMVAAHNQWRSKVGTPDLTWSNELAASSKIWADQLAQTGCTMKHSTTTNGENIYWASAVYSSDDTSWAQEVTEQNVVDAWGNEIKFYDYASNTCHGVCGHYTQVVWRSTSAVGCAMALCSDKAQIWVCQYNPRGNMMGEKPY